MEYRNLGASGLKVSLVGLGCNNFGQRMPGETAKARPSPQCRPFSWCSDTQGTGAPASR